MTATLNSAPIEKIQIYIPEYGIWTARITMTGGDEFPPDSIAQIVCFDLTLNGTIKTGANYVNKASYLIVGGGGNWCRKIPPLGERTLTGTKLSSVSKSIMEAANVAGQNAGSEGVENISVPTDKFLGQYWQRQAGTASSALSSLSPWYVDLNGTTILNSRQSSALTQKYLVQSYDPMFGTVNIMVPESNLLAGFVPGVIISEGVPVDLTAKEIRILSNISELSIEVTV